MFTEPELKELASQLSKPNGEMGLAVAENMNLSNMNMIWSTADALELQNDDRILELGHGNCRHLAALMAKRGRMIYTGLEISELMHEEAMKINEELISSGKATFHLYAGSEIPFSDQGFDKIFTVNTLYFWQSPVAFFNQLHRVLKPGGILCIGFAWKAFMETLPFTRFGFELYDEDKIMQLIRQSGFKHYELIDHKETITGRGGEEMERAYAVLRLRKPAA